MRYALILMSEAFTVMAEALRDEEQTQPKPKSQPVKFQCPICGKTVGGKGNYIQHSRTHLENRENVSIWG